MKRSNPFPLCCLLLSIAVSSNISAAEVSSVFVQSTLDFNAILITEVDVLFVYSEQALEQVPSTKSAWYGNKRSILEIAGDDIDVVNLFVPQGFDSSMLSLPERRAEALKVFVFGQHDISTREPIDITDMARVQVQVNQFGIVVSSRE